MPKSLSLSLEAEDRPRSKRDALISLIHKYLFNLIRFSATSFLVNQGRKVTLVFDKVDAILAVRSPLPEFIRRSRLLSVMVPHYCLRTRLECVVFFWSYFFFFSES